ncbi:formate dehydrogenase subunit alpha, partial [Azospirillum sp. TSO22-1]|uniref:formate dehydrogenase subunit alpha n=1 Tax=Azospirillum sp. TSO22-1 TaxID=716789 RepID=UPI000D61E5A9
KRVARTLASNRPGTLVWCMGGTQHHVGNNNTRAYCVLQLALGNIGVAGGGANIFRGHDNVQGATDFGVTSDTLPGYYGLAEGAWRHWARVWDVPYDYFLGRFKDKKLMEASGITVSRWFDGVLEAKENMDQPDTIKGMVFWGHAPNSQTRLPDMQKAMEKLDVLVVIDPYPTMTAVLHNRKDGVYLLPAATQLETDGSRTASNRSVQWSFKVMEPLFEAKTDHEIMYLFARKFGFAEPMFKAIKVEGNVPSIEDLTREWNRGMWSVGYTGQSPERMKLHMQHQATFDKTTLRANGGPADGDFYGLPWPCWGTPEIKHPGSANLYDNSLPVAEGGGAFRARFGVERNGVTLLAEGAYPAGSEIKDGYPEVTMAMLQKMGWDKDLTEAEMAVMAKIGGEKIGAVSWTTDLSGGIQRVAIKHGIAPPGNAKARAVAWNFPDPVPVHREPLYTNRRDLVASYPTYKDTKSWRLPTLYKSIQDRDVSKEFPIILTSGRLVEYEGGGDETRSNPWLAELQQDMFVEINPTDANNLGLKDGQMVWVEGPERGKVKVKAMVTERVGKGVAFMPFHFGGWFQGEDRRGRYPQGADPIVLGEAANTATTYGYDSVTQMQETKVTLCRISAA